MTEPEQDRADMRRLQGGVASALDHLMERWQIRLRSYLMRHGLNNADACDLAQETFVRVFRHAGRFDPRRTFSTWLFQIALNLLRDHARRMRRRPTAPLAEAPEAVGNSTPQTNTEANEAAVAVRTAVNELPLPLREVVILAEFEHRSQAEIAEIIGATPKAVETRLYRARTKLRQSLQRWLNT
ncbi:MAG: RNA polymerase sigma factor [Opitutaceae bacterium]|jgi:RNA polymerase sigma factor (sigma-70 family)|nr:RNA polymerase sigma factor [Opitutaceae bacterium]